jgi:hypothetical protein
MTSQYLHIRRFAIVALAAIGFSSGCKPSVGRAPSLIVGPEILAVRANPAEAKPEDTVTYDMLVVSTDGTAAGATGSWDVCTTPKPPAESNSVAAACVQAPPGDSQGASFKTPVPTNACTLFGPIAPQPQAGQEPYRPRDPDSTGGYYLPVRTVVSGLGEQTLTAFAMERITCNLVGASALVIQDYNARHKPNANPGIAALDMVNANATHVSFADGPITVQSGAEIALQAAFASDSAETYPVFDSDTQALVDHRESLRLFWFATDGEFAHDRTGRSEDDPETTSDNTWTAPHVAGATPVHLWLVLRDSRGGVDFVGYDLTVSP